MRRLLFFWFGLAPSVFATGLTFDEPTRKIEGNLENSVITTDFSFSNKTDKAIVIKECEPSCHCITAAVSGGKMRYEPGESGVIRVQFDVESATGTVPKEVAVVEDDERGNTPTMTLKLDIHIPEVLTIEPKAAKWDIGGELTPQTVALAVPAGNGPVHVKGVACSNPNFKFEFKTLEDGRRYELVITPLATKTTTIGTFNIETDFKVAKHATQVAYGVVKPPQRPEAKPAKP